MTYEELMTLLKTVFGDKADELTKAETGIKGLIESEKTKGIELYGKKDKESLKYKSLIKKLGYEKDSDDGLEGFVENLKNSLSNDGDKLTIAQLKSAVDALTESNKKEQEEKLKLKETSDSRLIEAELTKALGGKFNGVATIIKALKADGRVRVVGDKVAFAKGEDVITFEDGLKGLNTEFSDLVKNSQKGGTGFSPEIGGDGKQSKSFSEMSSKEIVDSWDI